MDVSDLVDYREWREYRLHGTCAAGRLTVDFRPGDSLTIRNGRRIIVSLSADEAQIACVDARLRPSWRHEGWLIRRLRGVRDRPLRFVCVTRQRIDVYIHPVFKFETQLDGVTMMVSTPPPAQGPPHYRTLITGSFKEDNDSGVSYHTPRCRVLGAS
ncbi:MAG: hypothetical protein ABR521_12270 [Gaiellaceae bacterium]